MLISELKMRRKRLNPVYFVFGACLFVWLSIPPHIADGMRSFSVAALAPTWELTREVQKYLADRPLFWEQKKQTDDALTKRLELENAMLRAQVEKMSVWLIDEERIEKQLERFHKIDGSIKPFLQRRAKHLACLIRDELIAMPCSVIYRDPSSWSSSLWVGIGNEANQSIGRQVIAKNSPVLSGASLVGVIDYVGKKQSRVRLITDASLCPSVRAARGFFKNDEEGALLAKGELHGSGGPLWRARSSRLKGVGFNFDFPDEEGGPPIGVDLLKEGDLLVTTGFDGVFPPDLVVGTISHIDPMLPGAFTYDIDVSPSASDLNHLKTLYVLPPRSE